jgi:hypothetical protein
LETNSPSLHQTQGDSAIDSDVAIKATPHAIASLIVRRFLMRTFRCVHGPMGCVPAAHR